MKRRKEYPMIIIPKTVLKLSDKFRGSFFQNITINPNVK